MARSMSNPGIVAATIACVLFWYLVTAGFAWLFIESSSDIGMPILVVLAIPILPGASLCALTGIHNGACVPASVIGNIVFYLVVAFIVRHRQISHDTGMSVGSENADEEDENEPKRR